MLPCPGVMAMHATVSPERTDPHAQRSLDVLVVDDDEGARLALASAARLLGHRCRVASTGAEALVMHAAEPADVIVSDWRMPGMDGLELCRRVRLLDEGTYTYLLFTSAEASKHDFLEAVRAGADDCLTKPIDLDDLEGRFITAARVVQAYRALAERNAHLRHDSQAFFRAARVDPLTGVSNRLQLEEDLVSLEAHVTRYGRPMSVAMCDIDAFKHYNDGHGHLAGDEALRRIAHAIRRSLRRADHVYRYGGEEFLAILPEQDTDAAAGAMARVRNAVEGLGIRHAPGARHRDVTVSIGLAPVSPRMGSVREAIARADRALYRAKALGGNTLVVDETR